MSYRTMTNFEKRAKDKAIAKRYLDLIVHKGYLSDNQIMLEIAEDEGVSFSTVKKIITKKE